MCALARVRVQLSAIVIKRAQVLQWDEGQSRIARLWATSQARARVTRQCSMTMLSIDRRGLLPRRAYRLAAPVSAPPVCLALRVIAPPAPGRPGRPLFCCETHLANRFTRVAIFLSASAAARLDCAAESSVRAASTSRISVSCCAFSSSVRSASTSMSRSTHLTVSFPECAGRLRE